MRKVLFFVIFGLLTACMAVLKAYSLFPMWGVSAYMCILGFSLYFIAVQKNMTIRIIRGTSISKAASLPMGVVGICGKAQRFKNPCDIKPVFYDELAFTPFYINDGTGIVYVKPNNAELLLAGNKKWDTKYHNREGMIQEGDFIYCIGTAVKSDAEDFSSEVLEALKKGKRNLPYIRKYDNDRDVKISQEKWAASKDEIKESVINENIAGRENESMEITRGNENKIFILSGKTKQELIKYLSSGTLATLITGLSFIGLAIFDMLARDGKFSESVRFAYLHALHSSESLIAVLIAVVFLGGLIFIFIRYCVNDPEAFLRLFLDMTRKSHN